MYSHSGQKVAKPFISWLLSTIQLSEGIHTLLRRKIILISKVDIGENDMCLKDPRPRNKSTIENARCGNSVDLKRIR